MKLKTILLASSSGASAFVLPASLRNIFSNELDTSSADWSETVLEEPAIASAWEEVVHKATVATEENYPSEEELVIEVDMPESKSFVGTTDLTLYQIISKNKNFSKFLHYVDKIPKMAHLLNSTGQDYTLFVPTNTAFDVHHGKPHHPDGGDAPPAEIERWLKYHICEGLWPMSRLVSTTTLPTLLEEKRLGSKPQRLRANIGLGGIKLNLNSKVIAANIPAKKGLFYVLSKTLEPPPSIANEISSLHDVFSTLNKAYERTGFVDWMHNQHTTGWTVFAPLNVAFEKLGHEVNKFLFEDAKGKAYLQALLRYQVVANTVLYSNVMYDDKSKGEEPFPRQHRVDLQTKLGNAKVAIEIIRFGTHVTMALNDYVTVVVRDGIANNGVMHMVGTVPLPPGKGKDNGREMTVKELMERLDPYMHPKLDEEAEDEEADWWDL